MGREQARDATIKSRNRMPGYKTRNTARVTKNATQDPREYERKRAAANIPLKRNSVNCCRLGRRLFKESVRQEVNERKTYISKTTGS
jgi:hypothetical protein